jgi:hypothetical protein
MLLTLTKHTHTPYISDRLTLTLLQCTRNIEKKEKRKNLD